MVGYLLVVLTVAITTGDILYVKRKKPYLYNNDRSKTARSK